MLRPDHIAGLYSYGDVTVRSYPSPGGAFRIWWATTGEHAPYALDANKNQIPDTVELVAKVGDEIAAKQKGSAWKWPIADDSLLKEPTNYGGDGRIDIYLYNFDAGDGKFEVDECKKQGQINQCTGYLLLQKDFLLSSYASNEEGIRVVLSHEFFHAIQAAYASPIPGWWSEGSATWFEEYFYPQQNDFERLCRYYLLEPMRSLDDRQRGPADTFAYGTALFVWHLAQTLTPLAIHEVLTRQSEGIAIIDALKEVAQKRQTTLQALFESFAIKNLFTGRRAPTSNGYPQAKELAEVPVQLQTLSQFNWDVQVASLATKYGQLNPTRPLALTLRVIDGFQPISVYVITKKSFETNQKGQQLALGQTLRVEPSGEALYLVFVNGHKSTNDRAARIEVRHAVTTPPAEPLPTEPSPSEPPREQTQPTEPPTTNADTDAGSPPQDSDLPPQPPTGCGCTTSSPGPETLVLWLLFLLPFLRHQMLR